MDRVAMVVAVDFSQTIGLGSLIVGSLVALVGLAVLFYGTRWRAAYSVASTQAEELRKALDDERARAEHAVERERQSLALVADQKRTIARLEALPDLSKILEFLTGQEAVAAERTAAAVGQVEKMLAMHEERAQDRHESQIAVLAGIAANLERMTPKGG